jgi:hypothetical protein
MTLGSAVTPAAGEPLDQLKATLLTLRDSGDDGFEGLVTALLGLITHASFHLAASGILRAHRLPFTRCPSLKASWASGYASP